MNAIKLILIISVISLINTNVFALELWSGTKTFMNKDLNASDILKVELNAFGEAIVTMQTGSTKAKVSLSDDKEVISLSMPLNTGSIEAYPMVLDIETGERRQVKALYTTVQIDIEGNEFSIYTTETHKICYKDFDPKTQTLKFPFNGCEVKKSAQKREPLYNVSDNLDTIKFNLEEDDSISLPLSPSSSQDLMIKLSKDSTVKSLDDNSVNFSSWSIKDDKLILKAVDGSVYTYTKLRDVLGLEQVLVSVESNTITNNNEQIYLGLIAKDENLNLQNLGMTDIVGSYLSATKVHGEPIVYEFYSDGIGGFASPNSGFSSWKWTVKNGDIIADRYFFVNSGEYTGKVDTKEDYEICNNNPENCFNYQSRTYEILSKQGNRFIMRRKFHSNYMNFNDNSSTKANVTKSLWVFFKQ